MRILLLLVLLLLIPTEALACDTGDEASGPNCDHTEWVKYGLLKQPYTTLYRGDDRTQNVTWSDFGDLEASEEEYITVYGIHGELNKFVWSRDALKYVWPR